MSDQYWEGLTPLEASCFGLMTLVLQREKTIRGLCRVKKHKMEVRSTSFDYTERPRTSAQSVIRTRRRGYVTALRQAGPVRELSGQGHAGNWSPHVTRVWRTLSALVPQCAKA